MPLAGMERAFSPVISLGSCSGALPQTGMKWAFGPPIRAAKVIPPLETQRAIVAEIEAEQALVAANRELITRFEQKIQATLARVWSEEVADISSNPNTISASILTR